MQKHKVRVAHVLGNLTLAGLHPRVRSLVRELPAYSHAIIFNSGNRGPLYDAFAETCEMVQCTYPRGSALGGLGYVPRLAAALATPSTISAPLEGWFEYCASPTSVSGSLFRCPVTSTYCQSRTHQFSMTRRSAR